MHTTVRNSLYRIKELSHLCGTYLYAVPIFQIKIHLGEYLLILNYIFTLYLQSFNPHPTIQTKSPGTNLPTDKQKYYVVFLFCKAGTAQVLLSSFPVTLYRNVSSRFAGADSLAAAATLLLQVQLQDEILNFFPFVFHHPTREPTLQVHGLLKVNDRILVTERDKFIARICKEIFTQTSAFPHNLQSVPLLRMDCIFKSFAVSEEFVTYGFSKVVETA